MIFNGFCIIIHVLLNGISHSYGCASDLYSSVDGHVFRSTRQYDTTMCICQASTVRDMPQNKREQSVAICHHGLYRSYRKGCSIRKGAVLIGGAVDLYSVCLTT